MEENKRILNIFLLCMLFPMFLTSQSTITKVFYYDNEWNYVESSDLASFTRIISFNTDDLNYNKPIGWVEDYYEPSGNLQWRGKFSYYDIDNKENNILNGVVTWYYDSPNKTKHRESYYYLGNLEGETSYWHKNGILHFTKNYSNGIIVDDNVKYYNEKGIIYKSEEYKSGLVDGIICSFYEDGNYKKMQIVSNGIINPWSLEFDQYGSCKKVWRDDFTNNKNSWLNTSKTNYRGEINENTGIYEFKSFSKEGFCYPTYINIPELNPFSNFVIETKIKNLSQNTFRILFGYQDWDNYASLDLLQKNNILYYKLNRVIDGVKRPIIKDWQKIESFYNFNDYNKFQLRQFYDDKEEDFLLGLVVNGEYVSSFASPFMKGFNFGYSVCQDNNKLYVDYLEIRYPFDFESSDINTSECKSSGTGFAINSNGYIATNFHVIKNCENIYVKGINGDTASIKADVVMKDSLNDLAILKVDKWLGSIVYGFNTDELDVLEDVFAYGYPMTKVLGENIKATNGTISSTTALNNDDNRYYQHTAPIQPGNSGGPLFDIDGNVVGINTLGYTELENVFASVKVEYLSNHMYRLGISNPKSNQLKNLDKSDQYLRIVDFVYRIIVK